MAKTHITHVNDGLVFLDHWIIRKRGSCRVKRLGGAGVNKMVAITAAVSSNLGEVKHAAGHNDKRGRSTGILRGSLSTRCLGDRRQLDMPRGKVIDAGQSGNHSVNKFDTVERLNAFMRNLRASISSPTIRQLCPTTGTRSFSGNSGTGWRESIAPPSRSYIIGCALQRLDGRRLGSWVS